MQSMGRSSAHTSTKVKMLTPFSLRSRHADATTLSAIVQQQHQPDEAPRRRSGSERSLPGSIPAAAELHGHRGSDGSPRISLPARIAQPDSSDAQTAVTDDVIDSRAQGVIASSLQSISEASADKKSSESGTSTTTITTKSSQDLNARLAASLTRWNARRVTSDDTDTITTKNSPDLSTQLRQIAVTGDVTNARAQGTTTSSPSDGQPTSAGDLVDSGVTGMVTSSHRVNLQSTDTSSTVQASGTRSTPAVQPSTESTRAQPPSRPPHSHSASLSDMLNVEPRTIDDRTTSRPRSTIYGDIRDRVFGTKQPTIGGKPVSPFSKFEPLRDEIGKRSPADITGTGRSTHADSVSKETASHAPAKTPQISGTKPETSQSLASESYVTVPPVPPVTTPDIGFGLATPQTKGGFSEVETKALAVTSHVSSTGHVPSVVSSATSNDLVVDSGRVSAPSQLLVSSVTGKRQQTAATTADAHQQRDPAGRQANIGVGRPLTTTAEVHPWTQALPGTSFHRKLDADTPTKVETPTGKAEIQQARGVAPASTTAGQTTSADPSVLPATSPPSVQMSRGKTIPLPASRVDWAKQRFAVSQSLDAGSVVISDSSSPKMKHRTFTVPQPEAHITQETVLSNLDESISKLAAVTASRMVSSASAVQQFPASQPVVSSPAVLPPSTAAQSPPFKPLTVSPPVTISSRVAIVHGLQMSPPSSTTPPRTRTEPTLTIYQSAAGRPSDVSAADVRLATRTDGGSDFQSTTSISASSTSLPQNDWRSPGRPVQPAASIAVSQRPTPAVVSSNAFAASTVQPHVPSTSVLPTPIAVSFPSAVSSMPSVSRSHIVTTAPESTSFPPHIQTYMPMFSVEKPNVSPVLARPALPTVTAHVWTPQVPQIRLSAQSLKSVVVMESPVPESKLVLVAPSASIVSQKSVPDTTVPTSGGSRMEDTDALYLALTRQEPRSSRSPQIEAPMISTKPGHVSASQTHVTTAAQRTQVAVTQNQVQRPVQSSQIGVQTPVQTQTSQAGVSQIQVSKPAQPSHVATVQIQAKSSAQSSNISPIEPRGQTQPTRMPVAQVETKSTGVTSGAVAAPVTSADVHRGTTSQSVGDSRTRPTERQGVTVPVSDRQKVASSSVAGHRNQVEQYQDRPLMVSSSGLDLQRRGGTAAVDDEVDRALRALDSIAAETRSLSTSLSRTRTLSASATTTPSRGQTSPASTAVVVGSPRDAAPVPDQKRLRQKSPRAETSRLHAALSLDSSGVIKKHLAHLENIFRPGASDPHVKKSVHLRKPMPLRKAQTVDLTTVGIGVDPELMQLLRTRKEKSASDDEDAAAKPRDDVVGSTQRYCTVGNPHNVFRSYLCRNTVI